MNTALKLTIGALLLFIALVMHAQGPIPPTLWQARGTNYLAVCAGTNGVFSPWSNEIFLVTKMRSDLTWDPSPTPGVVYFIGIGRSSGNYTGTNCVGRTNSLAWPLPPKPVRWSILCDGQPLVCWSNMPCVVETVRTNVFTNVIPAMFFRAYPAMGWVSISASTDAVHFVSGWKLQQTTNGVLTFTNS